MPKRTGYVPPWDRSPRRSRSPHRGNYFQKGIIHKVCSKFSGGHYFKAHIHKNYCIHMCRIEWPTGFHWFLGKPALLQQKNANDFSEFISCIFQTFLKVSKHSVKLLRLIHVNGSTFYSVKYTVFFRLMVL